VRIWFSAAKGPAAAAAQFRNTEGQNCCLIHISAWIQAGLWPPQHAGTRASSMFWSHSDCARHAAARPIGWPVAHLDGVADFVLTAAISITRANPIRKPEAKCAEPPCVQSLTIDPAAKHREPTTANNLFLLTKPPASYESRAVTSNLHRSTLLPDAPADGRVMRPASL
jgi:hypothetical protein